MKRMTFILIFTLVFSSGAFAKAKITSVSVEKIEENNASVAIGYTGVFDGTPEVSTRNGILQVAIPDSVVWPKIEKKVEIGQLGTTLLAYQFNKDLVRFRALIPFNLESKNDQISLNIKDNQIIVSFPVPSNDNEKIAVGENKGIAPISSTAAVSTKSASSHKKADDYDESYLQKLLNDKKSVNKKELFPMKELSDDKVAMVLSGTDKTNNGTSMAVTMMSLKFAGFLALVLGIFFVVVNIFKKGVMKKGKLGFLNNTDVVSVLNTTYVGPKKSLMLVKVHKQIFLISNDERGMNFLSEVRDTTGLLKDGEQLISGDNFDSNLNLAEVEKKEFRLKEVSSELVRPRPEEKKDSLADFLDSRPVVDQVKLSDQIKNKVKNLKALQ